MVVKPLSKVEYETLVILGISSRFIFLDQSGVKISSMSRQWHVIFNDPSRISLNGTLKILLIASYIFWKNITRWLQTKQCLEMLWIVSDLLFDLIWHEGKFLDFRDSRQMTLPLSKHFVHLPVQCACAHKMSVCLYDILWTELYYTTHAWFGE